MREFRSSIIGVLISLASLVICSRTPTNAANVANVANVGNIPNIPRWLLRSHALQRAALASPRPSPSFDYEAYLAKVKEYRLPYSVWPISYDLLLIPNLADAKFEGNVTIKATVQIETNVVLLHSHRLDIVSVTVSDSSRQLVHSTYTLLPVPQMMNITTQKTLPFEQTFYITIKFKGVLNDDSLGFYRSSYPTPNGTEWIATTHFLPMFARTAFPCFDEPMFRAQFSISIIRFQHQRVLTNMILKDTSFPIKSLDNRVMDEFFATPSMPVHALAFVVHEFYFIADDLEEYWVWSRQDALGQCRTALSVATELLPAFESYTGVAFPLPKMALAAIPDLNAEAAENWAVVTIREPFLLVNRSSSSAASIEKVATTIANKFARQWFGNYVTMAWWDHAWLYEGLATYLQYFITHLKIPEMRLNEKFILEVTHYALSIDGIRNHQPLSQLVNTPKEIMEMFGEINHYKVAAVFKMMRNFLGSAFRSGLEIFLKQKHEDGGVANPDDLYTALEFARLWYSVDMPSGTNIFLFVEQYFNQIGYPLLTVTRHAGSETVDIRIRQTPYRSPRSRKEIPDQVWTIPFSCARRKMYHMDNTAVEYWLQKDEEVVLRNALLEEDEWIICNVQQTGYFRVNYDKENWNLLTHQLNTAPEEIHYINRAQILDDSYTLALDEKLPFLSALNILRYLKWERDLIPWQTGIQKLRDLYTRYEVTHLASDLKQFAREAVADFYHIVGFHPTQEDCHATRVFRSVLTMTACELQLPDCLSQANFVYVNKTDNLSGIPGDIKETVLCVAVRTDSSTTTWNHLWNFYRQSSDASEKDTILSALGCTTSEKLLKKFLFKLIDDRDVDIRKHNKQLVFGSVLRYHEGVTSALKFVKEMLPNLKKYEKAGEIVTSLLSRMRSVVKSKEHERLLDESIAAASKVNEKIYDDVAASSRLTKQAARENTEEYERRLPELSKAVNKYYKRPQEAAGKTRNSASSNRTPTPFMLVVSLTIILVPLASASALV